MDSINTLENISTTENSVIYLSDENSSDSEMSTNMGESSLEQLLANQRDEFLVGYESIMGDLTRSYQECSKIDEEIEKVKLDYKNKMKKLYKKQKRLRRRITSYKRTKRSCNPLKLAYETKYDCPICFGRVVGENIYHIQCSHLLCKYCYMLSSTRSICPVCRTPIESLYTFMKCGERYTIRNVDIDKPFRVGDLTL